jgi:hypothetical protein
MPTDDEEGLLILDLARSWRELRLEHTGGIENGLMEFGSCNTCDLLMKIENVLLTSYPGKDIHQDIENILRCRE